MKQLQGSIPALVVGSFAMALLVPSTSVFAAGGKPTSAPPALVQTPQEIADRAYNAGLAYRDKAWKLEAAATEAEGVEAAKYRKKAQKRFRRAISEFRVATRNSPRMHQAFSSLGYALRKSGEYEQALEAYDRALELAPGYSEAVEYRGETYLHLGRLADVQSAYIELFAASRSHADQLMEAITGWLLLEHHEPIEGIEEFETWVEERGELARQTAELAGDSRRWGA